MNSSIGVLGVSGRLPAPTPVMIEGMDTHTTEQSPVINGAAMPVLEDKAAEPVIERPRWSASESARRCNVGRATIQRALDAKRFPNAVKGENGWEIPLEDLLAAGFTPDRPSKPDEDEGDRGDDRAGTGELPEHLKRQVELEIELSQARARIEIEQAHRRAAELISEQKDALIANQSAALRMLEEARRDAKTERETALAMVQEVAQRAAEAAVRAEQAERAVHEQQPEPKPVPVTVEERPAGWFKRTFGPQ